MTPQQYDAWYDSPRGQWIGRTEFELLRRFVDTRPGQSLLDVGCGTGWFTRRFAHAGLVVTGVDVDASAIEFARQRSDRGIAYLEGNACCLPFPDRSFDQVVSVTALCFIDDWGRAIAEMARVARRRFVLGLLNKHSLLWLEKGRSGGKGSYRGAHWHTRAEVDGALAGLLIGQVNFSTAIFLPAGGVVARAVEWLLPNSLPWGAFLVVSCDVAR